MPLLPSLDLFRENKRNNNTTTLICIALHCISFHFILFPPRTKGPPYHNPGKPLPKRQDCPEEAFVDVQAMTREEFLTMDVVAISYCWLAKDHPDPNREHLAVIARILELHARGS